MVARGTVYILLLMGVVMAQTGEVVHLPPPKTKGKMSVEEAIARRRSRREFENVPLTLEQLGQILWAAQGITDREHGFRAAPSAGATYPFETSVVVGAVEGLVPGIYHYIPHGHTLVLLKRGDFRRALCDASLRQEFIAEAPASIVLAADYQRTARFYGERAYRYVPMEAGHIGENIHLQCEALGLGTVMVGAFYDEQVRDILDIELDPLYVIPVGKPK